MSRQRRGSVYLAVVATVSAVTVLTLTGVALRKSFNERARSGIHGQDAQRAARSAAELAIHGAIASEEVFVAQARSAGTLFSGLAIDSGTINATAVDADTGTIATGATTRYRVETEGVSGEARSRLAFTMRKQEPELTQLVRDLGAIAYWPLDEETGTSVADDVIGTFDGTYTDPSRVGVVTHEHGNASPRYDWITRRTEIAHNAAFELSEGVIAFWVRWDTMPILGNQMAAISKELPSIRSSACFAVTLESGGDLVVILDDQDENGGRLEVDNNEGVISIGQWHHIAVTWGDKLRLFVDGVNVAENNRIKVGLQAASGKDEIDGNSGPWMFGVRNKTVLFNTPAHPTFGSVARVALFDLNLGESAIRELYEASSMPGPLELEQGSFVRVVD